MHHCKVSMDLEFYLSEQQFSLDILAGKLSDLFQSKALCRILRLVLMLVAEILILRLLKGRGVPCPCDGGHWTLNASFTRVGSNCHDLYSQRKNEEQEWISASPEGENAPLSLLWQLCILCKRIRISSRFAGRKPSDLVISWVVDQRSASWLSSIR